MGAHDAPVSRAYRRFQAVAMVVAGATIGAGIGSIGIIADTWVPILVLAAVEVFRILVGVTMYPDLARSWRWWILPVVALGSGPIVRIALPATVAPFLLGVAVAVYVLGIVAYALIDVRLDPGGRWGGRYV
jgi:hypothetical protein